MEPKRLPPALHTLVVLTALALSFLFVSTPTLNRYSLQAVALSTLVFFGVKSLNRQKIHHFIPQHASVEVALVTFIFTLLILATGGTESILYPLTYIYLFLLVFSTYTQTAIITTLGLMLHQYLLMPAGSSYIDLFDLISLPVVLIFFIFAKQQHEEVIKERQVLEDETRSLTQLENQVEVLASQLNLAQTQLNSTVQELDQIYQLLNQVRQETSRLAELNLDQAQQRQVVRLQIIIEEKLKTLTSMHSVN